MAGELSTFGVEIAARAAAAALRTLNHLSDSFEVQPINKDSLQRDEIFDQLDSAGHKFGEGFDGCPACVDLLAQAPGLLMGIMQQGAPDG